jgi:hypothetical protein
VICTDCAKETRIRKAMNSMAASAPPSAIAKDEPTAAASAKSGTPTLRLSDRSLERIVGDEAQRWLPCDS